MIDIKDIQGNVIYSTEINKGAKRKFTLMKEDYVTLPFSLEEPVSFPIGSYAEIDGMRYEIVDLQKPTLNNSTGGYDYQLRLDAYYWKWKNKIFKFTPEVGGQEASWSLTASLDVHLGIFLRNLEALGYTYEGIEFGFSIDATVENKALALTYENMNMTDALSAMAEAAECEWWVTDNVIHFGRCEYGTPVDFIINENVAEMTRSESKSDYATRLYVFGSTRNIPSNYRPVDENVVVNGVVQRRLMLPEGIPCIDAYEGMAEEEAIEEVVVLDDVYPRTEGNISSVETYEDSVENEDGTTNTETFYRFKDDGITFSYDYILEGEELKVVFTSGSLNGMEFGLAFNPKDEDEKLEDGSWNPEAQLFEIVANEDYGRKLPDSTLNPKIGDTYILIGWDATKIADLGLVEKAEEELYAKGLELSAKRKIDPNTYNCKMMSDYMFGLDEEGNQNKSYSKHFDVGDRVNLVNPAYFENGRQSRIIGFEYSLDYPFDNPIYIVGETIAYSRIGALEGKVEALTYAGQTYTGGSGSGVYVIGTNDSTKPNNRNVFSALMSDKRFLRKDKDDRSVGQIASDVGFEAGEFVPEATGAACYQDKDGNWHIETDHLRVRKKATFTEIEVQEVHHVGGQMLLTAANMIVDYVFEMEDRYRCYFLKKDSDGREVENLWQTGDQAYCNTFNLEKQADGTLGNHYLWRLVVGTNLDTKDDADTRTFGDITISTADYNFADLSKEVFGENSGAPEAGDEIVQIGYQPDDDPGRQNAIIIAGAGSGSPYIYEFTGINWFKFPEPETQIKPGNNVFTGKMHIQPGSTGADSLTDLPDEIFKAAQIGGVNLLLNSGFTGNYKTEDLQRTSHTESDFDLYSRNFLYWEGNATLNENDTDAASTWSANIGLLEQKVTLIDNEFYVVSFKAKGKQAKVYVGNTSQTVELTSEYQRYVLKYSFMHTVIGQHRFRIEGDATVCDLQLERGTIATDYKPSPLDNDKSFAEFQSLYYLSDALKHGSTTILNGLILSSVIQLGNYLEGEMQKVNAGMSGIYHDDNDVAFWGGGTFEQAIRTVMKFKQNPRYRPTDAEWQNMANFVVSHGGDIFMRGYIHALGGYFRGAIHADSGVFYNVKSPNGNFEIDKDGNVKITGKFQTSIEGNRIVIDPETKSIALYDELERETAAIKFYSDVGELWTYGNVHLRRYQQDSDNVVMESFITPSQVDIIDYVSKYETRYSAGFVQMVSSDGKNAEVTLGMSKKYLSDNLLSDYKWITNLRLGQLPENVDDVTEGGVYSDEGVLKIKPITENT